VLGVVPHIQGKHTPAARGQYVHHQSMSDVAEAYRTVRTAIHFGTTRGAKTVLVTSPAPGDGKSTTASNLAIALAQAGHRTMLIDCDFRRPVQHTIYELGDELGLSSVIAGTGKLRDAVRRTPVGRLYVLPCGPVPSNPSEILTSKRFEQVMKALDAAFDRIVIDSPPVAPVADASILAASSDATVLVLRTNKSTRKLSAGALEALYAVGANVLGAVVNDVPRRKGGYGYYGGGYYGTYGVSRRPAPALDAGSAPIPSEAVVLDGPSSTADHSRRASANGPGADAGHDGNGENGDRSAAEGTSTLVRSPRQARPGETPAGVDELLP
jgi:succinoglycan biosynthesis transport protein ExoP